MSVELGVVTGLGLVMFFYAYIAFKLSESRDHQAISMFLFLMSLVFSWLVVTTTSVIVKDNGTLGKMVENDLSLAYFAVVIGGVITLIYFVLRTMVWPMMAAKKEKEFRL